MRYRFGPYELDESAGELRRDGAPVTVQPKPLALLSLLLRERHRIVPIDELLGRLWPDAAVTPSSLTRAVSLARTAIGDRGRSGRIRSYTRRGYRFHGEVAVLGDAGEAATPAAGIVPAGVGEGGVPFVGREAALARLQTAWGEAVAGGGGSAIVSGPAGIGKTCLVEVFATEVRRRGGLTLRGRALEEEGEPAFWVWAQVLRGLQEADPAALQVPGLAHSGELAALWPELAPERDETAPDLPPEQRRFQFFDAVARALRQAAAARPILILFEDVHWADPASLRLLEHLAFELTSAPILIVATVREDPRGREHPGTRTLLVMRRQRRCAMVQLEGLKGPAIQALVESVAGRAVPGLADRLLDRTGGVPLFLREALRRLAEEDAFDAPPLDSLAEASIDWVGESLEALSKPCRELVAAASVLGREFSVPLVADLAGVERGEALDLLDEAVGTAVVEEDPETPARYRFVHDLFREAAYRGLSPGARARLHHRTAELLEQHHAEELDRVASELAHHHHLGLAVGDAERALACAVRAAERAFAGSAYEKTAHHWRQALAALDHVERNDPTRRLGTLLALGEASRLAGDRRGRREHFGQALELARQLAHDEAFAAAAVGLCDPAEWGVGDAFTREALAEALERLADGPPESEIRIATRMGLLDAITDRQDAEPRVRRAVELARKLGAPELLEEALYALHLLLGGPEGLGERRAILPELVEVASQSRDPDAAVIAVLDVACDTLQLGDAAEATRTRRLADRTAGTPPHPRTLWHRSVYDTGLALLEGRLDEVEGRVEETLTLGRRVQHPYARGCCDAHMASYYAERDQPQAILTVLERALSARQGPREWVHALVARAHAALGNTGDACELYRGVAEGGFQRVPRNLRWIATMVQLAHLAVEVDDAEGARELYALLRPFEHHHGILPMVVCYAGPVAFALARIQASLGHVDEVAELFEEAGAAAAGLGARPMQAHIHLARGQFLLHRGERRAARAELGAAAALAADLGMPGVERQANQRLADPSP